MRLWTIQDEEVYNTIIESGKYCCDASKSECLEDKQFVKAYDWLVGKMEEKLGEAPDGVKYPVWAWAYKPDLRTLRGKSGKRCVRIEFEIDEKEIFITDYFNWHCALNNFPFFDIEDDDEWEQVYQKYCRLENEERELELKKSWESFIYQELPEKIKCAQVTFWELRKSQIKKITFFIAK